MLGPDAARTTSPPTQGLPAFLVDRLVEELALLWEREATRPDTPDRPGLAAQVEVLDGLLLTLRGGGVPSRLELRLLLHSYCGHPDYDPAWTRL